MGGQGFWNPLFLRHSQVWELYSVEALLRRLNETRTLVGKSIDWFGRLIRMGILKTFPSLGII